MNIGDEVYAVVRQGLNYKIVQGHITGVMDRAHSVSNGKKDFSEVKRFYQIDSDDYVFENMVPSDNVFSLEDKEKAISKRNELLGIKSKAEIEDTKLKKAKTMLDSIKKEGKWETKEDIEETLIKLFKEGKLHTDDISDKSLFDDSFFDRFEKRLLTRLF